MRQSRMLPVRLLRNWSPAGRRHRQSQARLSTTGNQSLISYFASVATQTGLPLIFTEIGYESASDAAAQPFATSTHVYDPALQANLYTAFFEAWQQSGNNALTGVYFWNWDPNAAEVGPSNGPNFSPQGESAQTVVTANFSTAGPALQVTPATSIFASGNQGGTFSPASFAYQLKATSGSVGYSISGVPSWLTASSTSGTVSTSATTITFSINASATTLSPASYAAMITFTDTTNNDTAQTISAALTVDGTYLLSVSVSGNGTVTSSPSGINCSSTCSANYASGTGVILTAAPAAGWVIDGWGGACNGNGTSSTCNVTMSAAESATVTFALSGGAQATPDWVSAVSGSDANPCTHTAPCLTFAGALANTTTGGEIDVLAPGDYGPVTITKAVSIYNDGTGVAGALATSGTSGITVIAGASDASSARPEFQRVYGIGRIRRRLQQRRAVAHRQLRVPGFCHDGHHIRARHRQRRNRRDGGSGLGNPCQRRWDIGEANGRHCRECHCQQIRIDKNGGGGLRADGTGGPGTINSPSRTVRSASTPATASTPSWPGQRRRQHHAQRHRLERAHRIQSNRDKGGTATVTVGHSEIYGNTTGVQSVGGGALLSYSNTHLTGNTANGSFTGTASLQ